MWDIETAELAPGVYSDKMSMIGTFDGQEYRNFTAWEPFLAYVMQRKYSGWRWFAHNGGRFDTNALFDYIRHCRSELRFSFYCVGSCVVNLTLYDGSKHWRFCDSYRLMDSSLKDLTREFKVAHQKLPFDPASIEYNKNDCLGLYEVLTEFFGAFSVTAETIASYALRVYRTHFMRTTLYKPPRRIEDFVRKSYFGGRCEVYRWNEANLNKYDVNSLYPSVMRGPIPTIYSGMSRTLPDDDSKIGFYEAEIDYPEVYLPVLPTLIGGRLFFPVGKFTGYWSSCELREAIKDGAGVKIISGAVFETEPIFDEFIDSVYQARLEAKAAGNEGRAYALKKLMNSCYGKFGQRRKQVSYIQDPGTSRLDPTNPNSPLLWPIGLPGSGIAYYEKECRSHHILPHISAAITSRARLKTREYLLSAGNIWYTDTDSIFTDGTLPTGSGLGELKLEAVGKFSPYGLKEYQFGGHWNIKGVSIYRTDPMTGQKVEHPEIGDKYIAGGKITYPRRAGFMESLRAGMDTFRSVEATKGRQPRVEKRARDFLTGNTRPWRAIELYNVVEGVKTMKKGKFIYIPQELKAFQPNRGKPKFETIRAAVVRLGGLRRKSVFERIFDVMLNRYVQRPRGEWKKVPRTVLNALVKDTGLEPNDEMVPSLREEGFHQLETEEDLIYLLQTEAGRKTIKDTDTATKLEDKMSAYQPTFEDEHEGFLEWRPGGGHWQEPGDPTPVRLLPKKGSKEDTPF